MATANKPAAKKTATKPRTRKAPAAKAAAPKAPATAKTAAKPAPARKPAARTAKPAPKPAKRRVGLISAITLGVVAAGSAVAYAFRRYLVPGNAEHAAPDLALDAPRPDEFHRAPDAFRPDPTAAVPASERDGLRPATGPLPSLVTH